MARDVSPAAFQHAVMLYQQRRLGDAEKILGQILQRHANHADALHLLGTIAQETGRVPRAAMLLGKAVRLNPNAAPLHDSLAGVLNELGRREDALAHWDKAIEIEPGFVEAHINRGSVLKALGRLDAAVAAYDRALALAPHFAEAHYNRAIALTVLRQFGAALESCDRAIALNPGFAEAYFSRGAILADLKRDDEAVVSFRQTIALQPGHAEAYYNIGTACLGAGRLHDAVGHFGNAIALKPDHADAYHNRGIALQELDQYEAAIENQKKALALRPDFEFLPSDLLQLHLTTCEWGGLETKIAQLTGKLESGEKAFRPFIALLTLPSPGLQRKAAEIYAARKYPPDKRLRPLVGKPRAEKFRIGYFSPDFREHPVSYLMAGLFEHHDRTRFHTVGFAFGPEANDAMAQRVARGLDECIDVRHMPDDAVAQLARDKGIDIAIDLGGFTNHTRPGIFALRAAPVQAGYIGYLGTMGVEYIDYLIADPVLVPERDRQHYAEKIVYLTSFQSNTTDLPVSEAPLSRARAGLPDTGFVFCCFNNNFKILPDVFAAWVRILNATQGSVLWLYVAGEAAIRNLRATAAALGLDPSRLVFAKRVPRPEYLARLQLADLFLDTSPYNAGTTASDALWMGLPVLTRLGETFAGRMGASLLTAIGMPELIASSPEAYVAMAISLADDPDRMRAIKRKLAANRLTTSLFDTAQFARDIEAAYTAMIERHRAGLAPDHIDVTALSRRSIIAQ